MLPERVAEAARRELERSLYALLARYGAAPGPALTEAVRGALEALTEALAESARDGASLTPLEVARIRLNKFAAAQLSPALFRDAGTLTRLRAELRTLASGWLAAHAADLPQRG